LLEPPTKIKQEQPLSRTDGMLFEVQPEKSTILLVAEAWHATGMAQEASRILDTINRKEMTSQKETVEKQIPVGNLEKPHRNQTAGVLYSNILQIPSTVTSDHKGSPATLRKGRMV
jgi:pentatricopeptide repeat domain-containing protein 1